MNKPHNNHPCQWTREDFSTSKCLLLPERSRLAYCSGRRLLLYTDQSATAIGENGTGKMEIFNLDQLDGARDGPECAETLLDDLEVVDVASTLDEIYLLASGSIFHFLKTVVLKNPNLKSPTMQGTSPTTARVC